MIFPNKIQIWLKADGFLFPTVGITGQELDDGALVTRLESERHMSSQPHADYLLFCRKLIPN